MNTEYGNFRNEKSLRYRLYEVVEFVDVTGDGMADYDVYDVVMIIVFLASLIPLMVKQESPLTITIDRVTVAVFIVDYFLRWSVADYKLKKKGILPFLLYPLTFMAIVDLLSILPVVVDFGEDLTENDPDAEDDALTQSIPCSESGPVFQFDHYHQ